MTRFSARPSQHHRLPPLAAALSLGMAGALAGLAIPVDWTDAILPPGIVAPQVVLTALCALLSAALGGMAARRVAPRAILPDAPGAQATVGQALSIAQVEAALCAAAPDRPLPDRPLPDLAGMTLSELATRLARALGGQPAPGNFDDGERAYYPAASSTPTQSMPPDALEALVGQIPASGETGPLVIFPGRMTAFPAPRAPTAGPAVTRPPDPGEASQALHAALAVLRRMGAGT